MSNKVYFLGLPEKNWPYHEKGQDPLLWSIYPELVYHGFIVEDINDFEFRDIHVLPIKSRLVYVRSGNLLPNLAFPSTRHIVVSSNIANILRNEKNVSLMDTKIRLVDASMPSRKEIPSEKFKASNSSHDFFLSLPDKSHTSAPYHEVILGNMVKILRSKIDHERIYNHLIPKSRESYEACRTILIEDEFLTKDIIHEYSMIKTFGGLAVKPELFHAIKDFIDLDILGVAEYELPN